jgi:hypothetical protein
MQIPTNRPGTANTVERELVYNYYNIKKAIYEAPPAPANRHFYVENQGTYPMPTVAERIIWTPGDEELLIPGGMMWIASIALPIAPGHGAEAAAIWNHIQNVAA